MSRTAAQINECGLSNQDLITATALIHCRYRGLFSDISHEIAENGEPILLVWGIRDTEQPQFKYSQWNGNYICRDCASGEVYSNDRLGDLLGEVRSNYPQMSAF